MLSLVWVGNKWEKEIVLFKIYHLRLQMECLIFLQLFDPYFYVRFNYFNIFKILWSSKKFLDFKIEQVLSVNEVFSLMWDSVIFLGLIQHVKTGGWCILVWFISFLLRFFHPLSKQVFLSCTILSTYTIYNLFPAQHLIPGNFRTVTCVNKKSIMNSYSVSHVIFTCKLLVFSAPKTH